MAQLTTMNEVSDAQLREAVESAKRSTELEEKLKKAVEAQASVEGKLDLAEEKLSHYEKCLATVEDEHQELVLKKIEVEDSLKKVLWN
ncbi:hypothetical protein RJT34_26709 [Clitoria ternatea]|uniref:Uncharacterized protein n=1 Tax=Clitoria ternatea TaxID=43366 RepID=A0AAN9F709_CLITE